MDVTEFRHRKDELFRRSAASPLTPEQRAAFSGLRYFSEDPALRFEVTLERGGPTETEEIQTSDGQVRHMARAGIVRFPLDQREVTLATYEQGDDLFIPFRDATSGVDTYGAGRYVEAYPLGDDRYLLDLNLAYNPYCAYNEDWSCPLPPRENWLDVPIRAGERAFH